MSSDALGRSVEAAIAPLVASLGGWGVVSGHWRTDDDGARTLWLVTRTEIQRVELQAQAWLLPQVQVILTRVGAPHAVVWDLRLEMTSAEELRA